MVDDHSTKNQISVDGNVGNLIYCTLKGVLLTFVDKNNNGYLIGHRREGALRAEFYKSTFNCNFYLITGRHWFQTLF